MNIKKGVVTFALVCVVANIATIGAMAASFSYSNTTSTLYLGYTTNPSNYARTLSVSGRPSKGDHGAKVILKNDSGTVVASKIFPYYGSVSPLTNNVNGSVKRKIYVKPVESGESISGAVSYSWN